MARPTGLPRLSTWCPLGKETLRELPCSQLVGCYLGGGEGLLRPTRPRRQKLRSKLRLDEGTVAAAAAVAGPGALAAAAARTRRATASGASVGVAAVARWGASRGRWRRGRGRSCIFPIWAQNSQAVALAVRRTPLWTLKATQLLIFAANVCLVRFIPVYYDEVGLSRWLMSLLLVIMPLASFVGALFWSARVDRSGEYKRTLMGTSAVAVAVVFTYLSPAVRVSFPLLLVVTALHGFFAGPSGPLVDALCLKVLAEEPGGKEAYGDQRLWSAVGWGGMALVVGQLVDCFGSASMFFSFAFLVALNVSLIGIWMPRVPRVLPVATAAASAAEGVARPMSTAAWLRALGRFEGSWLFANLVVYGALMALVENFLNVFLLQDFVSPPKVLIGAATAVMCVFEIPVFKFIGRCWREDRWSLISVLVVAEFLLAARCILYMLVPRGRPWLVLLVEPLHGFTFAAMWCATVEYARRLAPPGTEAKTQALANGLFYYISFAAGSFAWGFLVQRPPQGLGFARCFLFDAGVLVGWLAVWMAGWAVAHRRGWLS